MTVVRYDANTIPSVRWINDPVRNPKRLVAASTFAGCGGASLGLKLAGYKVLYANEFIPSAIETYRANASRETHLDVRDVRRVQPEDVMRRCGVRRGELDYLDGSPPCKAFSAAARHVRFGKRRDDVVNYSDNVKQRVDDLFENFVRLLRGIEPRVFVAENVPGLAMSVNKGMFLDIERDFVKSGYRVRAALVDASRLGVPQARTRLVFVGVRNDLRTDPVFPKPYAHVTGVSEVIPHITAVQSTSTRATVGVDEFVTDNWRDARMPSPVMTVAASSFDPRNKMGASGWIQTTDGSHRKISIPELKALFGFPEDFILTGSFHKRWERLARSHVPLAVYAIAATIRDEILLPLRRRGRER